jgi:integrase
MQYKYLKSTFAYGVKKDILKSNICDKASPPKFEEYSPATYDEEQFLELWNHVQNKYDRVPIALEAGVELKRSEIFGLTWNNIDLKNGTITIEKTKVRFDKKVSDTLNNIFIKKEKFDKVT